MQPNNSTNTEDNLPFELIEPWDNEVDGDSMANEICEVIERHCKLKPQFVTAAVLWIISSYAINHFRVFPKLGVTSPTKRCGKSTFLETINGLLNRPLLASNVSAAALFRLIEQWQPSLEIDEFDSFYNGNDELRGILNSGHTRKSAVVLRVVSERSDFLVKKFSTWCPIVIAKIGALPETIQDRSVSIVLERKRASEKLDRLSLNHDELCVDIRRRCLRWSEDAADELKNSEPHMPSVRNDRALDNWIPLLAVADSLGGEWGERARAAMCNIEKADERTVSEDLTDDLLVDIQRVLGDWSHKHMFSAHLVDLLNSLLDRPWSELDRGRGLTQYGLANKLRPFRVTPRKVRIGDKSQQGYVSAQLNDLSSRYTDPGDDAEQWNKPNRNGDIGVGQVEQECRDVPGGAQQSINGDTVCTDVPDQSQERISTGLEAESAELVPEPTQPQEAADSSAEAYRKASDGE